MSLANTYKCMGLHKKWTYLSKETIILLIHLFHKRLLSV